MLDTVLSTQIESSHLQSMVNSSFPDFFSPHEDKPESVIAFLRKTIFSKKPCEYLKKCIDISVTCYIHRVFVKP